MNYIPLRSFVFPQLSKHTTPCVGVEDVVKGRPSCIPVAIIPPPEEIPDAGSAAIVDSDGKYAYIAIPGDVVKVYKFHIDTVTWMPDPIIINIATSSLKFVHEKVNDSLVLYSDQENPFIAVINPSETDHIEALFEVEEKFLCIFHNPGTNQLKAVLNTFYMVIECDTLKYEIYPLEGWIPNITRVLDYEVCNTMVAFTIEGIPPIVFFDYIKNCYILPDVSRAIAREFAGCDGKWCKLAHIDETKNLIHFSTSKINLGMPSMPMLKPVAVKDAEGEIFYIVRVVVSFVPVVAFKDVNKSIILMVKAPIGYKLHYINFNIPEKPEKPEIESFEENYLKLRIPNIFRHRFHSSCKLIAHNFTIDVIKQYLLDADNLLSHDSDYSIIKMKLRSHMTYKLYLSVSNGNGCAESEKIEIVSVYSKLPESLSQFRISGVLSDYVLDFRWNELSEEEFFTDEKVSIKIESKLYDNFWVDILEAPGESVGVRAKITPDMKVFRAYVENKYGKSLPTQELVYPVSVNCFTTPRPKTIMSIEQRQFLKGEFLKNERPNHKQREEIAKIIGSTFKSVTCWFQNQRSKTRRREV